MIRTFSELFIVLLIGFVSANCSKKARNNKTNDMQDIIGTMLLLPVHPTWGIMERDTTITLTNDPKLIVYFNNTTCMPCALKELRHWNPIVNQNLALRNKGVFIELLFILHSDRNNKQVRNAVVEQDFTYPIMYDERGEFEENNTLPENELMHAFFIDGDNKVIFVGNPLLSLKHEKVFNALFVGFAKHQL